MSLFRCIKSDLYKFHHSLILWIHLFIPLVGSIIILLYYSTSKWGYLAKITAYVEALAIVFPLLIGMICSITILQEEQAGNFQYLIISTKVKIVALISKIIVLLLGAFASITIALSTFKLGFEYILKENSISLNCYIKLGGMLFLANIFIYIVHIYLSLKFGKGTSISIGIIGTLTSAIMTTGLGDKIWSFIPWGWSSRLCDYAILKEINISIYNTIQNQIQNGTIIMITATIIEFIFILIWFYMWEGNKSLE